MRGTYSNPNKGRQLIRFDGMELQDDLRTITPTDIDALIDVRNKVLVLFEAKLKGKEVPRGQKLALERIVNDARVAGKNAIAIVCDHEVEDAGTDILLCDSIAREVYETEHQEWRPMRRRMTAKELADFYIGRYYRPGA